MSEEKRETGKGVQKITVTESDVGITLDRWFKRNVPELTFGRLQKLMRKGDVRLDGKRVKGKEKLEVGQVVRVPPIGVVPPQPVREAKSLSDADIQEIQNMVLYMDDSVIVLNKPPGLATQGGTGQTRHIDGLLEGLRYGSEHRPRLVHRLDKDTSGVLLIGRSPNASSALAKGFQSKTCDKRYFALVVGVPDERRGRIKLTMEKVPGKYGEKMEVTKDGKKSMTDYFVVESAAQRTAWLALKPHTGRTHQLRLHTAEMGTPIVGDGKYGGAEAFLTGSISRKLHLHARFISFPHPNGGMMTATAPLPDHMKASFEMLDFDLDSYEDLFTEDSM